MENTSIDDELLIDKIKVTEPIWNKNNPDYKSATVKTFLYIDITKECFPHVTAMEVAKRFEYLRGRFTKELKKGICMSGSSPQPKSKWHLMKRMMFLRDQITPRETVGNVVGRKGKAPPVSATKVTTEVRHSPRLLQRLGLTVSPAKSKSPRPGTSLRSPEVTGLVDKGVLDSLQPELGALCADSSKSDLSVDSDLPEEEEPIPAKKVKVMLGRKVPKKSTESAILKATAVMDKAEKLMSTTAPSANDHFASYIASSLSALPPKLQIEARAQVFEKITYYQSMINE